MNGASKNAPAYSKLILGTVQLGMRYGIRKGPNKPPDRSEVREILRVAADGGLAGIDTAFEYGESEGRIGEGIPLRWRPRLITKTPKLRPGALFRSTALLVNEAYGISCRLLGVNRCDTLLVHDSELFNQPGAELVAAALAELKESGRVEKIGISIYTRRQLDKALGFLSPDVVQLPLSLADQRLLEDGSLASLSAAGCEVHARSVFLQGALLMEPSELPAGMGGLEAAILELKRRAARCGISPLQALLRFVHDLPFVTSVVCGVNTASQLKEIVNAVDESLPPDFDTSPLPVADETLLNPGTWATRIQI